MDKLYDFGLSELFLLIALAAAKKYQINLDYSHLDSSSFSVHGQYNKVLSELSESQQQESEVEPIPITITHGYSREHRPDLKQFIIDKEVPTSVREQLHFVLVEHMDEVWPTALYPEPVGQGDSVAVGNS